MNFDFCFLRSGLCGDYFTPRIGPESVTPKACHFFPVFLILKLLSSFVRPSSLLNRPWICVIGGILIWGSYQDDYVSSLYFHRYISYSF